MKNPWVSKPGSDSVTEVSHAGQLFATGQQGENADVILWG